MTPPQSYGGTAPVFTNSSEKSLILYSQITLHDPTFQILLPQRVNKYRPTKQGRRHKFQ